MDQFTEILQIATQRVGEKYFQLPIGGSENPIYRERVYCYELYHQMRILWPYNSNYSLCGEVDKNGHPLIYGNLLDMVKPDFLVHIPGEMNNYAVIEVKSINGARVGIKKDLRTLTAFCQRANYQRAVYLFYGDCNADNILENMLWMMTG